MISEAAGFLSRSGVNFIASVVVDETQIDNAFFDSLKQLLFYGGDADL
jgi:hypothetical protein